MSTKGMVRVLVKSPFTLVRDPKELEARNANLKAGEAAVPAEQSYAAGLHYMHPNDAKHWYVVAHTAADADQNLAVDDLAGASFGEVQRRAQAAGVEFNPDESVRELAARIIKAEAAGVSAEAIGEKQTAAPDPKPADAGPRAQGDPQRGGLEHEPPPPPGETTGAAPQGGVNPIGFDNAQTSTTSPPPAGKPAEVAEAAAADKGTKATTKK